MGWAAWSTLLIVALVLWALSRNVAEPDVILMGGALGVVSLSVLSERFPGVCDLAAPLVGRRFAMDGSATGMTPR